MNKYVKFGYSIRKRMENKAIGYSYAIFQNQELKDHGSFGWAVTPADQPPGFKQSSTRRMTTMSMGKTITAVALIKALAMHEPTPLTIDHKILKFLPSDWVKGYGVDTLTFRQLLTHKSKLVPAASDPDAYESLKVTIMVGKMGPLKYENCNYCLMRILIPYLILGPKHFKEFEGGNNNDSITASHYISFVRKHVLEAAGLKGADIVPTGSQPFTHYYNFDNPSLSSFDQWLGDDAKLRCGAGYWNLSAQEYGRFITALVAGKIMKLERWKLMESELLGCGPLGKLGDRRGHNGGFHFGNGAGCAGGWLTCPDGVTAVLLINSHGGKHADPPALLSDAYDAALN